jgi:hypothetical protein
MNFVPLLLVLGISPLARAEDTIDSLLAKARSAGEAKQPAAAAEAIGLAGALAHKSGDLAGESRVADAFREMTGALPAGGEGFGRRAALEAVMKKLDASRCGALLSAHALARELLLEATEAGDTEFAASAADVLARAASASKGKLGRSGAPLAKYGLGLKLLATGKSKEADAALDPALAAFAKERWIDLAMHAGTELAALRRKAGDDQGASAALTTVGALFDATTDADLFQTWRSMIDVRLKDASPEVLAGFEHAKSFFSGGTSVSAAGGAPGGAAGRTKIGSALASLPKDKPVLTVRRSKEGFAIREGFDPKFDATKPAKGGTWFASDGGVILAFHGSGVCLWSIDLEAARGAPGGVSTREFLPALYSLGDGETWSVSKDGVVTVR